MIFKRDNIKLGLILGLIAPMFGLIIFACLRFGPTNLYWFFNFLLDKKQDISHRIFSSSLSISLIANALVFTFYINTYRDRTAKGILISTAFYGLIILLIKTFA